MHSVLADLRYAGRELRRRPGFAITAVLSLALGIGATTAVFSVIYGVLLNPFPYVDSERMMQLGVVMQENGTPHYQKFVKDDFDRYAAIVQKLNLQIKQ